MASCYFIARSRKALTQLKFDVRGPTDARGIICKTPRASRGDSRKPSLQIREFLSLLWQRRTNVREAKSDRHRSRGLHYSKGVGVLHSAALLDSRKLTGEKQPSVEGCFSHLFVLSPTDSRRPSASACRARCLQLP